MEIFLNFFRQTDIHIHFDLNKQKKKKHPREPNEGLHEMGKISYKVPEMPPPALAKDLSQIPY